MPPTGRQNFGSLRKDGLVKAGSQRGFWALTFGGLESVPTPAKKSRRRKATGRKSAKPEGRTKAKPAAKSTRKTRRKATSKAASPALGKAVKNTAKKKPARRKAPAKRPAKGAPEVLPTPEGV